MRYILNREREKKNSKVLSSSLSVVGFTLIEIVIALAVVGLIMGVVVSQMDRMLDLDMKRTSGKLASTIRYLYNKAAMEKLYIKLVLDLDERAYWVEATTDPLVIAREGSEVTSSKRDNTKKDKGEEGKRRDTVTKEKEEEGKDSKEKVKDEDAVGEGAEKLKPPKPKFGQVDSFLLRPSKLPDTVFFKDLQVEHRQGAVESGKEVIYFFPNGYVESAIINLRDEDDEVHYSLRTHPLSGQVDTEANYRNRE